MVEPDKTYIPHPRSLFCGFTLDSNDGPVRSGRQAIQKFYREHDWGDVSRDDSGNPKDSDYIKQIPGTTIVEDEYLQNQLEAHHSHLGWPLPARLPVTPWGAPNATPQVIESGGCATRRMLVQMWSITLRADELAPENRFVSEVERALTCPDDTSRIRALEEVLASWGEVIPMAVIVGSAITATGVLAPDTKLEPTSSSSYSPNQSTFSDLSNFIDTRLQIQGKFERILKYHITGGRPDILLREGLDAWIESVKNTQAWEIIKVTSVIPITDILDSTIQQRIKALYANRSMIFRSPLVGALPQSKFKTEVNALRPIQQIEVGFSDGRIQSLSIRYVGGLVSGPYGCLGDATRLNKFNLARGEFITDIFIWPTDYFIVSFQLVKNTGHVSPIYGATRGITQPPHLLSGNGKALVGLSGGYDATGITQLQAIWHSDLEAINYRRTQTSFIGGPDGDFWNDLKFIGDRHTARISEIIARSAGAGYLAGLQITYTPHIGGYPVRHEAPIHGTEDGQVTTWTLEDGEHITGVRGRHDGTSICELQFMTDRPNRVSPAFGKPDGDFSFSFAAPDNQEGKNMVLQYMLGKSAERVNSIMFVWAELGSSNERIQIGTTSGSGGASDEPVWFQ
ncbi:unnamed protein product [Rhizoctonia solani]|uniref:Jacalin-type lectin domain-containing protein n=1 Tax=Rhizoctonia solani TaxID=456999 RepID=A0A8H3DI30_9AGAM|nr:unnamed protein product [Rhizoctonia solani]